MRDSLRLGRIAGFPVAVNWSVLVVVLLLAWGLAEGVLPQTAPGHATSTYWVAGLAGALLLVCSLLAHELAHAVVARRSGVVVEGLTLWMFGGVATLRGEARTPGADFRIAAAGPATSLVLAFAFAVGWISLAGLGAGDIVVSVAGWLASINLVLAVFNLIPGAPLDGGRVLRALLWMRSGDHDRAAATATDVGQVVGYCLVGLGLLAFVAGDPVGGLWTILIGWFLLTAARAEHEVTVAEHALRGMSVRDVMSGDVHTASAELTVEEFIDSHLLQGRHSAYPVVAWSGAVEGLVTLGQLRSVPTPARARTLVRDVALPLSQIAVCAPTDPVAGLLTRATQESGNRALAFDEGRLVGIVTPADITRVLEAKSLSR